MRSATTRNNRWLSALAAIGAFILFASCGSSVKDPDPGSGRGNVALFFSDNSSFYHQVVSTITGIRLVNSGTAEICALLGAPVTLDISNLANRAHYADLAGCPSGSYNRIDIDLRKDLRLMNQLGVASSCVYTHVLGENGEEQSLDCSDETGICRVSIRGGERDDWITVQEDRYNSIGIDFDLKKFTVRGFGSPSACAVTLSAARLSAPDLNAEGRTRSVTGSLDNLDTAGKTFTLIASGVSFTVDYSGILPALQPNIAVLLRTARSEGFKVSVLTREIDLEAGTLSANRILMKAAGTVSNVISQPQWSFTLAYGPEKILVGSHKPPAMIQGVFTDGSWINVTYDGYNAGGSEYLAAAIEVLPAGAILDD